MNLTSFFLKAVFWIIVGCFALFTIFIAGYALFASIVMYVLRYAFSSFSHFLIACAGIFIALVLISFISVLIYDLIYERKEKPVVKYFLCRQMGNLSDVVQYTNLSASSVKRVFKELERKGKIALFLTSENGDKLYKWTENIDFSEGMTSEEIQI